MREYVVKIGGKEAELLPARVSAVPFNQVWPGYQRPLSQTERAYFVNYCGPLPQRVEVAVLGGGDETYLVRPLSRGVAPERVGGVWRFTVTEYGPLVFESDGREALHLFFSRPAKPPESATYRFDEGEYEVGTLRLKSGESVYIGERAVVYGSIYARGASHIQVTGRGLLDGSREPRASIRCYEEDTIGTLRLYECDDVAVEGVVLRDSATWVMSLFGCSDVTIDNVKIVGQYRYNTDGIDLVNCARVTVRDSFIRAFDDGISLKGIDAYRERDVRDIAVERCVLWCGWGRTLEVGLETACERFSDIRFTDCDLIHNSAVCLDIQNGDWAKVERVSFEDIRVEYGPTLKEVIQRAPGEEYPLDMPTAVPALISISDPKYNLTNDPILNEPREEYGGVSDVLFRNVAAVGAEGMPAIELTETGPRGVFSDITLQNVTVNGRPVGPENVRANLAPDAVRFKK